MAAKLNGSIKGDRRSIGPSAFATSQVKSLWDDKEINANAKFRELRRAVERWRAQPTRIPKERAFYSALQTLLENAVRGGTGPVLSTRMDELHAWYTNNRPSVDITQELSIDGSGGSSGQVTNPSSRPLIKSLTTLGARSKFASIYDDREPPIKPPRLSRQTLEERRPQHDRLSESLSVGCLPRYPSLSLTGDLEPPSPMTSSLDSSLSPIKRFPVRSTMRKDATKGLPRSDEDATHGSDPTRADSRRAADATWQGMDGLSDREDDDDSGGGDVGGVTLAGPPPDLGVSLRESDLVHPDALPPRCHSAMDQLGHERLEAGVWDALRTRGVAEHETVSSKGKPLSLLQRLALQEEGKLERLRASWQEVEQRDARWQHDVQNAMARWSIHRSRLEEEMTRRQESSRMLTAAPRFHAEIPLYMLTQHQHGREPPHKSVPRGAGALRPDAGAHVGGKGVQEGGREGGDAGGRPVTGPSSYGGMTRLSPYTDVEMSKGGYNKARASSLGTMQLNQVLAEQARQEAASLADTLSVPLSRGYDQLHETLERALSPPPHRSTEDCLKVLPKPWGTFDPANASRRSGKKKAKPRSRLIKPPPFS